jgi:hypothetical protein
LDLVLAIFALLVNIGSFVISFMLGQTPN